MNEEYVWAKESVVCESWSGAIRDNILEGKKYKLYAKFKTSNMSSGLGYLVLTEGKQFVGFDSDYFMEIEEHVASRYNL